VLDPPTLAAPAEADTTGLALLSPLAPDGQHTRFGKLEGNILDGE
jgi:hypothetical protein